VSPAAFFQLRSIGGATWPPLPNSDASQAWSAYLTLDRTQWCTPGELETLQLSQLRTLLLHCYREVPYYRRLLAEIGFPKRPIETFDDFRRLPLLTRELYQANFADIQARGLPPDMKAMGTSFTSGTNGVPLQVLNTDRVGFWWRAFFLRDLEWSGMDPRGRLAAIRLSAMSKEALPSALEGRSYPSWRDGLDALIDTGPSFVMDIRQDPRRQLAWLQRIRPDYLLTMPSNLELLAPLLEERHSRLDGLRAIQSYAEPLPDTTRERVERAFGVPVKNLYSTSEAGYIASPCPEGPGLHVHSENVITEVLDAAGQPCRPGETGRLVFTTLHNFLAPFIRYEILDDVTLAPEACPCGRGLPLWSRVDGRRHLALYLPGGRRKSSMGITLGVRKVGGCRQFQIVQRAEDHVVLRVVPDSTWSPDYAERMRRVVHDEFESPIRVDVEELPSLERTPGGKLRVVVVEIGN
jgi:phenylacetate-CoA ligase